MNNVPIRSERGIAAVIAILLVGLLTLIGLAAMTNSNNEIQIAGNEMNATKSFYAAEAGLDVASAAVQAAFDSTGAPPATMPSGSVVLNNTTTAYVTTDLGPAAQRVLTDGALAGLVSLTKSYSILSIGVSQIDGAESRLTKVFDANLIPIFQFAVFYDDDMQACPLPPMTVTGRVNVNGNMYIQAFAGLRFDSYVTCGSNIYHNVKYGNYPTATADVSFKNSSGTYVSMKSGSTWLDATSSTWYEDASARWNGMVKDKAFGQSKLKLPLAGGNPHKMIERAAANPDSYEERSSLKFIDNKVYQKSGSVWVDVTGPITAAGIVTRASNKFHDGREGTDVDITDLNIGALYASSYAPSNGVIYFSDKTAGLDYPALRLDNAATLGAGLTIACENPVYTMGNFNSANKKPASILTDAFTILSSAWDDSKGALPKTSRNANSTTVNVAFITGDKPCTAANYQGGLENLPRFLEYWGSTKTCTIRGAMINLWNSQQATGDWGPNYYEPPTRDWGFDADFTDPTKLPPQTPSVVSFSNGGWSQSDVGGN